MNRPSASDLSTATRLFEERYADSSWANDPHKRSNWIGQFARALMNKRLNDEHRARFDRKDAAA